MLLLAGSTARAFSSSPRSPEAGCSPEWLGKEHVAHVADVEQCSEQTQTAADTLLAEGFEAMRAYINSTYVFTEGDDDNAGRIQLPYTFGHLLPADLEVSVEDFGPNMVIVIHPFFLTPALRSHSMPSYFPLPLKGRYRDEVALRNAKTKREGYVWIIADEYDTLKSETNYHNKASLTNTTWDWNTLKHRKDYINILLDGPKGSEYEGRRLIVSCGYQELGALGPTE